MFPQLVSVEQTFCCDHIPNVRSRLFEEMERSGVEIRPGATIAIAVGSRGIANIPLVVKTVVDWVRDKGGVPFLIPAMGSHGNGDAQAQKQILEGLGVTEEYTGAPIRSSMEVVELPSDGLPNHVYMDKNAYQADGTIVINRIKSHPDFTAETESGLMKMCTIGLGKHKQALEIHKCEIQVLQKTIVATARQVIRHGNLIMGIALLENAYHQTMDIQALRPVQFEEAEKQMLRRYKEISPQFPVDEFDILIVDEVGKEISGSGMETKIVGRIRSGSQEPVRPRIRYIIATDLTPASHGNACGMGLVDFMPRRLFDKIDIDATNENIVTCRCIEQGRMPLITRDDRQAVEFALRAMGNIPPDGPRVVRIQNTLRMDKLYMTRNLLELAARSPNVTCIGKCEVPLFRGDQRTLIPFGDLKEMEETASQTGRGL